MVTLNVEKEIEKLTGQKIKKLPNGRYVASVEIGLDETSKIQIEVVELGQSILNMINELKKDHILGKIKLFEIIVGELVDTVHSAYLRAYHGGERESIRTARHVTQTEPIGMMGGMGGNHGGYPVIQRKQRSLLRPTSWFG